MDSCQALLKRRYSLDSLDGFSFVPLMSFERLSDNSIRCVPCVVENEHGLCGLYAGEDYCYLVVTCKDNEDEENNMMQLVKRFDRGIPLSVLKKHMNTLLRFAGMSDRCL